jgi:hypothetical protein
MARAKEGLDVRSLIESTVAAVGQYTGENYIVGGCIARDKRGKPAGVLGPYTVENFNGGIVYESLFLRKAVLRFLELEERENG